MTRQQYYVRETPVRGYSVNYTKEGADIIVTNTLNPSLITIDDDMVPLAGGINMNEGDCFN